MPWTRLGWILPLAAVIALFLGFLLQPFTPSASLADQVETIASKLSCPACQGQSAAQSQSAVAYEMRQEIARQLQEGKTSEEILQYFQEEYGSWILLQPPVFRFWPWTLLLVGGGLLFLWWKGRHGLE
ncbi:MAG: cytochrome c-type biogenesis protein CcmH [Bacillota bacterium]|nr:cytochrome c-type biogenesis protein CcmH [Bacillota bacterium]